MNQQNNDVIEIDLLEVLKELKKKALIIILVTLIGGGAAGVYAYKFATPIYESTSKIYIMTQSTPTPSMTDLQMGSALTYDYQEMIVSRRFLVELKSHLGLDYTYNQLKGMVAVNNPSNTRIISISVRSADSEEAKMMANELAIISKKNISEIMQTDEPTFFESAIKSSHPVEPQKAKLISIGLLLGFILAAGIIVIRNVLNDRFTSSEEVERLLELPVLASIPQTETRVNKKKEMRNQKKAHRE